MSEPLRVVVLASGSGSNLQALLDRFNLGDDPSARVELVIGSRPGIVALDRARDADVPSAVPPAALPEATEGAEADEAFLLRCLEEVGAELVVLAGYLRLVPASVVQAFWGRMINIHPALLPSFGGHGMYGRRVHEAVLSRGCRVSGVTVHFVSEEYDRGPIIAQWPVPVMEKDDPASLAARVLRVEHRLLPAVVLAIARGRVKLSREGLAVWTDPLYGGESFGTASGGAFRYSESGPALGAGPTSEPPETQEN